MSERYENTPYCSVGRGHGGPCNGVRTTYCADSYRAAPVDQKDSNPKDAIGVQKLPLSLVPWVTIAYASLAHLCGALKYGKWNWRKAGVRASVYLDAIRRHLAKWESGEEVDEEGVPHLGSIIASVGIILDARAAGKLQDDRPPRVDTTKLFDELTPIVTQLKERHKDKAPRHYTIDDSEGGK
jgi:hypothetical protein